MVQSSWSRSAMHRTVPGTLNEKQGMLPYEDSCVEHIYEMRRAVCAIVYNHIHHGLTVLLHTSGHLRMCLAWNFLLGMLVAGLKRVIVPTLADV